MTLEQLQACVKRYLENAYPNGGFGKHEKRNVGYLTSDQGWEDRAAVCNAFTDPTALTRESLEGMGFDNAAVAGDAKRWIMHVGEYALHAIHQEISGWFFQASPIPDGYIFDLFPQPRSVGDVWRLLEQLSRDGGEG